MGLNTNEQSTEIPPRTSDYFSRFRKKAIWLIILIQFVIILLIAGALAFAGFSIFTPNFLVVMVAVGTAAIAGNIALFTQLYTPFRQVLSAISHISGEPSAEPFPNPNSKTIESNGLKPVVQSIYALSTKQDAEKNKKALDHENANNIILTQALDQTNAGVVVIDPNDSILYANHAAPITTADNKQRLVDFLYDNDESIQEWIQHCRLHTVNAEKTWHRVVVDTQQSENRKIYDLVATYKKGSATETILLFYERTDTYGPQDEDLNFIAFAAHELRGPITVIRGYLDVLGDELGPRLSKEYRELIERMIMSSNRLSSYINNILNASKFDRRHLKLKLEEASLSAIYATVRDDMSLRARLQGRLLSIDIPETLPTVAADIASIGEVIANLIDNAIKYSSPGGHINVTARQDGDIVRLSVEDFGIGMPDNVISNLFHKFYRSHRSKDKFQGTGIGLYICKAIIESHGGEIAVVSQEGKGSTFTISLPIYTSVKDKIDQNKTNESMISSRTAIKNHHMFKG